MRSVLEGLGDHVLELADQHDIRVWVCLNCAEIVGDAYEDPHRYIRITAPIDNRTSYLVALHELGHIAGTHSWNDLVLNQEASAWLWALDQAHITLKPDDWQVVQESLESYAKDRRFKQTKLFTDLLEDVRSRARV